MGNTKKLNKTAGKCDYQQQYKAIIEAEMVATPEGCTKNSPITPHPSVSTKTTNARKSLCQFSETLDVKNKTTV